MRIPVLVNIVFVFLFTAFASYPARAVIRNVPSVLTAPVVLYDEGGNVLADGDYGITVTLRDAEGNVLYREEQNVAIVNGSAELTIGQGYEAGSDFTRSAGGLSLDLFQNEGDVTVEIAVDGQSITHTTAILGSQPYAFVSEYAISVAADAVTSTSIVDGSIVADDLDAGFLAELTAAVADEGGEDVASEAATAALAAHEASSSGVHGVASGSAIVGVSEPQTLTNKTLDGTNHVSADAIDSGTLSESRIDGAIARDSELTFANLSGTASLAQMPSGLATDAEVQASYLPHTGGTIRGDVTLQNANIEVSPGYLIDGVDVGEVGAMAADHEERLDELESIPFTGWREILSGSWTPSACGIEQAVTIDEHDVAMGDAGGMGPEHFWVNVRISKAANAAASSVAIEWKPRLTYDGSRYRYQMIFSEVGTASANCSYHTVSYTIYISDLH